MNKTSASKYREGEFRTISLPSAASKRPTLLFFQDNDTVKTLPATIKLIGEFHLSNKNQIETTLKGENFQTQEIPLNPENNFQIMKIMKAWETLANKKENQATTSLERIHFSNSFCVTGHIIDTLKTNPTDIRIFTCHHQTRIHSIALTRELPDGSLYIDYLATHPFNIRSSLNLQETQIPYAGTALIHHLFKTCIEEKKTAIKLSCLKGSKGFYKKLQFKSLHKDSKFGPMIISSKRIKKQLEKISVDSSSTDNSPVKRKRTD